MSLLLKSMIRSRSWNAMSVISRISLTRTLRTLPLSHHAKAVIHKNNGQISRNLSTSQPRQAIPPILIAAIKPLSRVLAIVLGRRFRKWWSNLPEEQKEKVKASSRKHSKLWGALGMALTILAVYGYVTHIEESPITGRKRFLALKKDQVEKIANQEFEQLIEMYDNSGAVLSETHPYYDRIARVTSRILKANKDLAQVKEKTWSITVVAQEEQNAFVLPSGNIFVFTGMLDVCSNDDELGIVLSHEIAHVLLNHAAEQLSYINLISALAIIPLAVMWAFLPNDGIAVVADWFFNTTSKIMFELPFARHMETEADEVGLGMASRACFDVRNAPSFWGKMQVVTEMEDKFDPPEFLSTHPSHEHRQDNLAKLLPEALKMRTSCGCPKLGPIDPNLGLEKFIAAMKREADLKKAKKSRIIVIR